MAQTALSPHALHVHPLRSEGSTRFVRASGSPVHSSGSLDTTMGGTVRLVNRVDKSDKKKPCLHMPLHVHPLLPVGSTRIVWTRGSPIHSTESVAAAVSGTVEPIIAVPQVPPPPQVLQSDKSDKQPKATKANERVRQSQRVKAKDHRP